MTIGTLFSQNITGTIVAFIVALSSGAAFLICFREIVRESFSNHRPRLDGVLRRHRDVLLDEQNGAFVIQDSVFETLLAERASRAESAGEAWENRSTYLATVSFLGFVALAGVFAGVSHFV